MSNSREYKLRGVIVALFFARRLLQSQNFESSTPSMGRVTFEVSAIENLGGNFSASLTKRAFFITWNIFLLKLIGSNSRPHGNPNPTYEQSTLQL